MVSHSPLAAPWNAARAMLAARRAHPTRIELVEVAFDVELRDGTRIKISASAWC